MIGFIVLSVICGLGGVSTIQGVVGNVNFEGVDIKSFAAKLSIKSLLKDSISPIDGIMGLNIAGIVFITFFSVYIRR